MGLGSRFSVLQSINDNEIIPPEELETVGETKSNSNGSYHVEDVNKKLIEETKIGGTTAGSAFRGVNKRPGLKKWRRIARELVKKTGSNLDGRNGDFTVSPAGKAMVNVNGDSGWGDGPVIRSRADSMNSEDQSSRSSTAASAPGTKHDDQQRNGQIGPGKKARGFKIDKENSNSTMGSDSPSSNFVFVQGSDTVASKGRQSGTFANYDEESSDDAQYADKHLNEESDDVSQKHVAADSIEKHEGSVEQDPLVESIKGLQFAQEEFEREVQKWRDVGIDDSSILDGSIQKILELKDAKILELESTLNSGCVKAELEDWLMKIIQAEVEYVVITTTTKSLTEEPLHANKLDSKHTNILTHEIQATRKQDEKLETKEDVKKLQSRTCRCTSYLMIQLILLLVTLYLKYFPYSVEIVPT